MMNIRMRSGAGEVNGKMTRMSLAEVKVDVGSVYQTLTGNWKTVTAEYGKIEIEDDVMFGYETRAATADEIATATTPVDRKAEESFWNDFFDKVN